MVKMMEKFMVCPDCGSKVAVSMTSKGSGIANFTRIQCKDKTCTFVHVDRPEGADVPLGDDQSTKIKRNTDHAVNVLYILGFLASGDGGTEAARLLGLLGLPNATTMQARTFGNIEKQIGPVICDIGEEVIADNLKEEVKIVLGDRTLDTGGETELMYDLWLRKALPQELWPKLTTSADMGWQQKGSGRKYNSVSGHAFLVGTETRGILAKALCSKLCHYCKTWCRRHTVDEDPPVHDCTINHKGSSGSMEPVAILKMVVHLKEQHQAIVSVIVTDDDSSIKSKLKWRNEDWKANNNTDENPTIINGKGNIVPRPNRGKLPKDIPEPSFLADPNHRRKTMVGELYKLEAKPKTHPDKLTKKQLTKIKTESYSWNLTMTKMDCMRLVSTNFGFMARTLCDGNKSDDEILLCGKAVLEHHFDNHIYCGDWCRRKQEINDMEADDEAEPAAADDQPQRKKKKKYYRSKVKDAMLYERLKTIIARFVTLSALKELAHKMDTCVNESINNTISWFAPKNKVYAGTQSLANRIGMACGILSLGLLKYFELLFERLHLSMNADVHNYLSVKDGGRIRRLQKRRTAAFKRKRKADFYSKLKDEMSVAQQERDIRDGVYQSGIGMDGGYTELELDLDSSTGTTKPRRQKKKAAGGRKKSDMICPHCNKTGHCRRTSKDCDKHLPPKQQGRATLSGDVLKAVHNPQEVDVDEAADVVQVLDEMPLEDR